MAIVKFWAEVTGRTWAYSPQRGSDYFCYGEAWLRVDVFSHWSARVARSARFTWLSRLKSLWRVWEGKGNAYFLRPVYSAAW